VGRGVVCCRGRGLSGGSMGGGGVERRRFREGDIRSGKGRGGNGGMSGLLGPGSVDSEPRVRPALSECSPGLCWFQMVTGAAAIGA